MTDDPWSELAELYDWEHNDYEADLPLYFALAQRSGGPILEAACGSGRIVFPLARAGYDVSGVDSSNGMLERARARQQREGVTAGTVRLLAGDARTTDAGRGFGLALVALDSFGLFVDQASQLAVLTNLGLHLRRGGLLVLDVGNGNARACEPPKEVHHQLTRPDPWQGRPLTKWVLRSTDTAAQVDELTYLYDRLDEEGRVLRTVVSHPLRYFHRFELTLLVAQAGLLIDEVYGDYDLGPVMGDSPRLIVVARKPDS